jgi:putative nucleotidyltransferase with HDIG domain
VGDRSAPNLKRYLPQVLAATTAVIVLPMAVVSLLAGHAVLGSIFVTGPLAMLLSLAASSAGSAWWKKRPGAHDLVFSDLMIWGWVRRLRTERRLSRAVELLRGQDDLPSDRQVEYFTQLAAALEARDAYTHGHTRRVTGHATAIAERMGLPRNVVAKVRTAAAIHDIGKLNTPREVLNKPGRLTDEEFDVIKRHPVDGAEMAARLGDDEITAMVLHHHERLDGTGYPSRLAGDQIPLGARIIAVADTFDAITSKRPYRGASSHKKGIAILTKEAGTQLDPDAVRAFCSHYSGFRGVAAGSLLASAPGRMLPWQWGFSSVAPIVKGAAAAAVAGILGSSAAVLAKPSSAAGPRHAATAVARLAAHDSRAAAAPRPARAPVPKAGRATGRPSRQHPAPGHAHGTSAGAGSTRTGATPQAGSPPRKDGGGSTTAAGSAGHSGGPSSSPSQPNGSPPGGSSSPGGGGSTGGGGSGGGGGSPPGTTTTPSVTTTTPSVTVSTPPVTATTPVGTVTTPPVAVTTPPVTVTTPSVTVSSPSGTPSLP